MKIDKLIDKFKEAGRFSPHKTFSEVDLEKYETDLGNILPDNYKLVHLSGSYYKSNFHFLKPERLPVNPDLIAFACWNETLFAFHSKEGNNNDYPVYVVVGEFTEKKYANFLEWFSMVFDATIEPFNPG